MTSTAQRAVLVIGFIVIVSPPAAQAASSLHLPYETPVTAPVPDVQLSFEML